MVLGAVKGYNGVYMVAGAIVPDGCTATTNPVGTFAGVPHVIKLYLISEPRMLGKPRPHRE
jgi:hypothetical protein